MIKVYISVTNDIITDQRVNKIALSLSKLRVEIVIIGRKIDEKVKIDAKNVDGNRSCRGFMKIKI